MPRRVAPLGLALQDVERLAFLERAILLPERLVDQPLVLRLVRAAPSIEFVRAAVVSRI